MYSLKTHFPPPTGTHTQPLPGWVKDDHMPLTVMTLLCPNAGLELLQPQVAPGGHKSQCGGCSCWWSWRCLCPCLPGAPFQRSQHPHATSCRHFHLGPPQPQQLAPDFPLAHPVQSQPGLSAHMAPAHQHSGALHQSLTPLPTLQFQDVTGPSFLPQALHQQYLLQQQLLEAQHRRLVSHPRLVLPGAEVGTRVGLGEGARARAWAWPGVAETGAGLQAAGLLASLPGLADSHQVGLCRK